jgi:hypothetical protein
VSTFRYFDILNLLYFSKMPLFAVCLMGHGLRILSLLGVKLNGDVGIRKGTIAGIINIPSKQMTTQAA